MKNLSNKTAVVTGAGSGIGAALACALAREGCRLAISDVNAEGLARTENELKSIFKEKYDGKDAASHAANAVSGLGAGGSADGAADARIHAKILDVSDKKAMAAYPAEVETAFGGADVLVNNAGVTVAGTVEEHSIEDYEWVMSINFWGVVYGTKAFLPLLKKAPEANIVNVSSIFGIIAYPHQSAYNASKFAVRGFTEALRQELAGTNVHATCVHPGGIRTKIFDSCRFKSHPAGDSLERAAEAFQRLAPTSADEAARQIVRAIKTNEKRTVVGPDAAFLDLLQRFAPEEYPTVIRLAGFFL